MAINQSTELWEPVAGYEGFYEVSDQGNVRGVDRIDSAGRRWKGRTLKPKTHRNGYLCVHLWREGSGRMHYVHRLVLTAFRGSSDDMQACHNDGDCTNNRLSNLRWDTASENAYDRVRHGTHWATERSHCPRGHALEEPNLVAWTYRTNGHRSCLACAKEHYRASKSRDAFDGARADKNYAKIMA